VYLFELDECTVNDLEQRQYRSR